MRQLYVVTYDIRDDQRLRRVFKLMRGYGDHLQYSVFRCELNERERIELVEKLTQAIQAAEDQVLLFPLGPAGGQREVSVQALGVAYRPSLHEALIV